MLEAKETITNAGLTATRARIAVLNTLIMAKSALSHPEILEQLATQKEFDRVTIYRVLDWLTEHHLIHKISGENRAWKFQLSKTSYSPATTNQTDQQFLPSAHQHAHLHCSACGKVTCIHELEPHFPAQILAKYQVESIDINIKGLCVDCA